MSELGEGIKVIIFMWIPLLIIGTGLLVVTDKIEKECDRNRQAIKREEKRRRNVA